MCEVKFANKKTVPPGHWGINQTQRKGRTVGPRRQKCRGSENSKMI